MLVFPFILPQEQYQMSRLHHQVAIWEGFHRLIHRSPYLSAQYQLRLSF